MTRAFVRSLVSWQRAMLVASTRGEALPWDVDLEEAAFDRRTALKWVKFLDVRVIAAGEILSTAEDRGFRRDGKEFLNQETLREYLVEALAHAREHLASFDGTHRTGATNRSRNVNRRTQ